MVIDSMLAISHCVAQWEHKIPIGENMRNFTGAREDALGSQNNFTLVIMVTEVYIKNFKIIYCGGYLLPYSVMSTTPVCAGGGISVNAR